MIRGNALGKLDMWEHLLVKSKNRLYNSEQLFYFGSTVIARLFVVVETGGQHKIKELP